MNFSSALKAYPQKGVGWGFTGRTLRAGEMARFGEKENAAKQEEEEKLPERTSPGRKGCWKVPAHYRGEPEEHREQELGGLMRQWEEGNVCLQRRVLADWFGKEQSRHQNGTTPDTGATQLGAVFPPPGGRCWRETETRNGFEEPSPRNCHSQGGSKKANPGTTEALQEVRWGEAGGGSALWLGPQQELTFSKVDYTPGTVLHT